MIGPDEIVRTDPSNVLEIPVVKRSETVSESPALTGVGAKATECSTSGGNTLRVARLGVDDASPTLIVLLVPSEIPVVVDVKRETRMSAVSIPAPVKAFGDVVTGKLADVAPAGTTTGL